MALTGRRLMAPITAPGAIVQVNADEKKIIQAEFQKLLNDPSIKIEETTLNSITFTTSKQTTQKIIDDFGFGKSTISQALKAVQGSPCKQAAIMFYRNILEITSMRK